MMKRIRKKNIQNGKFRCQCRMSAWEGDILGLKNTTISQLSFFSLIEGQSLFNTSKLFRPEQYIQSHTMCTSIIFKTMNTTTWCIYDVHLISKPISLSLIDVDERCWSEILF